MSSVSIAVLRTYTVMFSWQVSLISKHTSDVMVVIVAMRGA